MTISEATKIAETLPYESRIAFIAFCAERCLKEANRHPAAREQLQKRPLLGEGLEMLWARAEQGTIPAPDRVNAILQHVSSYETPAPDMENVVYNADITLVQAARVLIKGMDVLQDPEKATGRYIAGASAGPFICVAQVYADYQNARNAERAVTDTALLRLHDWGNKPFSRKVFEGIPEWTRGELSKKYAENRLKGSADEDED
jgi:hypothetical protein